MNVRRATDADRAVLGELWHEFEAEVPEPPHRAHTFEEDWPEMLDIMSSGLALLAEDEEGPAGYALAKLEKAAVCFLDTIYVRPRARRGGVAKALMAEAAAWGASHGAHTMTLEVVSGNADGRAVYQRLGFAEESLTLFAPLSQIAGRVSAAQRAPSRGVIYLQTDDQDEVARAVRQYVPRLPGGSKGSVVTPPRNGWTAIYDELCEREPALLRRLALELSDRMGAIVLAIGVEEQAVVRYVLLERGRLVDEYASLPEYHGALPPGDVVALGANPTVLARLTGADPAAVRQVARTASTSSELLPAEDLLARIAAVLGLEGVSYAYAEARDLPNAAVLDRQ
jgi:GNAT superfamily N-acetyltransferase